MNARNEKLAVLAYPMHGHRKLVTEGYRTRDGHVIEWLAHLLDPQGAVGVYSRPEPAGLDWIKLKRASRRSTDPANAVFFDTPVVRVPPLRDRFAWWSKSAASYPVPAGTPETPAVVWNPFVSVSSATPVLFDERRTIVFDLLDDWTIHYAFEGIRPQVDEAYRRMFDRATHVTANGEGTVELARKYGRDDVVFIPNGVDPERFDSSSAASGRPRVGYIGKLGKRIDDELVVSTVRALPEVDFVIAGPVLDGDLDEQLSGLPNVTMPGDVHYDDVPDLMRTFDVGWVPHRVGEGEVGGDVIKTYEYRAAGLPVLATPFSGVTQRGLSDVHVIEGSGHVSWLQDAVAAGPRVPRALTPVPADATWRTKVETIVGLLQG